MSSYKINSASDYAVGQKCELQAYLEIFDGVQRSKTSVSDPFGKFSSRTDDSPYALVVNRAVEKDRPEKVSLQVNSPFILQTFREVIKSYSPVASDFTSPFELQNPSHMLIHYWEELQAYRSSAVGELRDHVDLLFEFMDHELGGKREEILAMIQKNQVDYQSAWALFRPGDVLYTEVEGEPWLLICDKASYEKDVQSGPYFEVRCKYASHDGKKSGEAAHTIIMWQKEHFPAQSLASITSLPIFPRQFFNMGEELEHSLRLRGQRFLSFRDFSVMAYDGKAQYLKEPPFGFYSESKCKKLWCQFFVDHIQDVQWDQDAWNSLVTGEKEKLVLQSLVTSHQFSAKARDQTQQKGKGLVVLLHGTPGSGKTLTAETAAEGTHRALITTSVGELNKNNYPASFELDLKKILRYATIWKAIVLLDEADVFLEARNEDSRSDRNALVAVFLKELEYFGGIVFLTTNRVETFDPAMKSRIHLSLTYSPPEVETRRQIWLQYLHAIPKGKSNVDPEQSIQDLVASKLNGREIANAITTAQTIARFQNKPLDIFHIHTVLDVGRKFDESLTNGGAI
ncbi:hypothetical protein JX265_007053 [Neoarthrinium moseri]|uniref:AAA+ ATPase domain-containing protein n=1 Tax=Neoarthrinium moseri TaxID=1658444 RepID=A0A9P9WKW9_9PEZI|nr:uncharacterized protein JN550_008003 [Neoarthrinium moseri]KAI1844688.1 hypothetical protein JX266_009144 [Neoarthrinium moseri]KAI1866025.1 hypothetical protein JN550_008003 [Neoarthrinium moseri]KAI1868230.1 hypothetical protein JX265_007053 [Neoarthrinium moseri]